MSTNHFKLTDPDNQGSGNVNRRAFFGLALASSAALALAACSSETTTTAPASSGAPSGGATSGGATGSGAPSDSDSAATGTRTISDVDDAKIEVPASPKKVVVLSEPTLDGLLALGVTPAGSISGRGQSGVPNYLADRAKDVQIIGTVAQVNYEQVGNLEPDLILVDSTGVDKRSEAFETLKKIAPVVYCGYAGGDWRINFRNVANAMNMVDKGEEIIKAYESTAAELKGKLAPKYGDKTFSIVRWAGNGPALILKELPAGQVLNDLGLKRPESQDRNGQGHSEPVSLENLATIDADYMFLGTLGGASQKNPNAQGSSGVQGAEEALAKAKETSGFTDLKAVKDDHVILVEGSKWTSTGGPLLLNGIIEDVKKALPL